MRKTKTFMSLFGSFVRFFRLTGRSASITAISTASTNLRYSASKSDDGMGNIAYHSSDREIHVEEVDQVVFVQEWVRTVAGPEVPESGNESAEGGRVVDRRLPNFDRRHPENDRRAGYGYDRRGAASTAGGMAQLIRGKRDRPKR